MQRNMLKMVVTSTLAILVFLGNFHGNLFAQGQEDDDDVPEGAASLAFVFDITGSMYDDLLQVIEGAAKILATTRSRQEKPLYNYVLVPFRDPDVGPVTKTTDHIVFQQELRDLYVQGGGDCPEMSISAIKTAIEICLPNSFIYVFTDASSKDFYLTEEVLALIQQKQSQVVFVLTGDCDNSTHPGYTAYEKIASTSSGQVFLLKKSQVNEVLNFVRVAVQSRKVNLISMDFPDNGIREFQIPVDSKLQELTISISGEKPRITLFDASGRRMKKTDMNTLLDINNALVVNVKNPVPGSWKMVVESEGKQSVRVTGLSTANFVAGFSRKPLNNMKESNHRPIGGVETHMLINTTDMEEPASFFQMELLDLNGRSLGNIDLIRDDKKPSLYRVPPFVPPEEFFYVKLIGIDDEAYKIERLTPTAVSRIVPGKPSPYMPEITKGYFGRTATLTCQVESLVPYNVTWFKEEVPIGTEQYFEDSGNATLEIPTANQYSEGIYFCKATNPAGSTRIPTFLDISEPPPAITVPKNASVLPGQDALLTCNIFSTVDYNITWYKSGFQNTLRTNQKFIDYRNGSLLVRDVQLDDEGLYICEAANEGGRSKEAAFILVQVAPIPIIDPSESSFVTGDTKELVCNAEGYPQPEITWTRAGQKMVANDKIRINGNRLTIRDMQRGDAGLYTCVASNPAGESRTVAKLNYIEAPRITSFESLTLVAAGDDAELFCGAVGIPQPTIKWYKGEVELKALSYVQISDNGAMKILGTQDLDAGEYICEAVNEAGSDSAILQLKVGSEPNIVQGPQNVGVDIGGDTTLECRAQGLPVPKVFWKRQSGKKLDFGGKVRQLSSGALQLSGVGLEDEGSYICVAQNQFGTAEASAYVSITGIEGPAIGYMDPVVQVNQGEYLELNCQTLIGNPPPTIQWLQYGGLVETDEYIKRNSDGVLVIENIQDFHSGDYICLASNVGGNASFIVAVEVQVPPTFVFTHPDDEEVEFEIVEGERVVLPCTVEGDPMPMITWFKDETPISLTDYHYYIREDGSLEIYTAEATDTGEYRCQATNVAGEIEKVVNLFVQVYPVIRGDPNEEYVVIENQTITLPCDAYGVPTPNTTWRKNFVPFLPESDKYVFGDFGLTISDAQVYDRAIYECVASNIAGMETKVITLYVHVPPVILGVGPSSQTVVTGDQVILNCENSGEPAPTVEWKKDEAFIYLFNEDTGYELMDDGSLLISSAEVSQTGSYVCVVTNEAGVDTRDFNLVVNEPASLPANLTTFKDIIEGNDVILRCPATGTPPPLITWYKDGSLITGDFAGVIILEDGSLQIINTDAEDTASYKCVAENVAGRDEHEVDLKVYVRPYFTGEDAGKVGVVDTTEVVVTKNVTLVCSIEADPPPIITWLKNGYELIPENLDDRIEISEDGKLLTITDSDVTDTARYTCIAANIAGEAEKSFDLDVQVPPSIDLDTVSPGNNTVVKGNALYLDCPVSGTPRPKVTWYKDGEEINTDLDSNIKLIADGLRLEIVGARVSDTGRYKCVGENVAGTAEEDFDVDVFVSPTVDKPGEISKEEIVTNGSVSLTCPVSGIPLPEITWYKNNQPITVDTDEYIFKDDGWTLEIVSAQEVDTARYTCRAKNEAGEGKKTFELNVLVPPKIERDGLNLDPKVMINQTTVINCPVEGIPSPTITWFKNGIQLDASVQTRYEILSSGRQLKVKNAQLTDTAVFQCVAVNKAGSDTVDFNLFVTVPSKIQTYGVNRNPKVVADGSLVLTCTVTGVPIPDIIWLKNGDKIVEEENPNISIENQGMELIINDAKVDDTAIYTCRATNEAGDSDLSYNVNVQVPPTIDDDDDDDVEPELNVIQNNSITLNCPAKGVPEPEVIWLKNGQAIDFGVNSPYQLQANGKRLVIENAQVSDKALYTCVATNEAGSDKKDFELDVWVKPVIDEDGLDKTPRIIKGRTIELFCPTDGNPVPDIIWLKDTEPLKLDDRVEILLNGQQLRIKNATEKDTATYKCVARNPAGQDSISFDLEVHVAPTIDESNVVYYRKVVENRTIIIECPVSGIPVPEVIWLINDHPLLPGEGLTFTNNNYHLEIASAKTTDTAIYTCVASNAAGELRKKFDLEVQVPPRIDTTNLETDVTVIQNRSVALYCQVYSIPRSSIMWLKDDFPLLDWPYPGLRLTNQDQKLEVTNVQIDDAGKYVCQATNPAGQTKLEYNLTVHVPPEIAGSQLISNVAVKEGSPTTLECEATGIPEPGLTWIKDGEVIEINENPHIRILKDGKQLQLPSAEVTDTGRYVCHAENKAGISERKFNVQVQVPANIPRLRGLQNVAVVINEQLTLNCPAEGIPPPKITWKRQGQIIQQYSNPSIRILDNGKKLFIASAQLLDLGDYQCLVENVAGNSSVDYFVSVQVPPTISEGPTQVESVVNTGVVLLCESLGLPDPTVRWTKDGFPFPSTGLRHNMRESGTIDFTSVRLEDAGTYVCKASNEAGTATRQIQLDVQVPPKMRRIRPLNLKVIKGEGIELPCEVTGSPKPRISWQKGPSSITGKRGVEIMESGSLYLKRTSRSDQGVYICIAQNSAGTAFGQIRLQILVPPVIQIRGNSFTVNSAEKIVLPCRASGRPRPKISWSKDGVLIKASNNFQKVLRNGLAIPYVRPEDAGTYTCTAKNTAGESSEDITLDVNVKPQIAEASRLLTFTVGEDAVIECAAIGIPPPTVEWQKNGRPLDLNSNKYIVSEFGTLTIRKLTEQDTGSYMCVATNKAGRAYQERLLRIQVPPSFIVVPRVQEVLLNTRLALRCTADGIPTPTIFWKKNDSPIQAPLSVNGRSLLVVPNARIEDGGIYTCIAQNPAGQAEVSSMVTVTVPPEILTPPRDKSVSIAERVILPCQVGGDPRPEVIWMKNGRPVQLSDRIQQLENDSLVIYRSTSSDAGEYKCVATNDAGTSFEVAMLTVREPPSFLVEPQHTRVDEGDTAMVDCVGFGEPMPTIDWMIGWDILQDEGRLSILPNNSLKIVAAQLSDSGTYRCLATNNLGQSFIEINITVVVHGQWSSWLNWEPCSVTCGKGVQSRRRSCDNPEPANDGRGCQGLPVEPRSCRERQCPQDGNWGSWLPWEPCSVTCDAGIRTRRRLCDNPRPKFGGDLCSGEGIQREPCYLAPCAVNGNWSNWSDWQQCSRTCGEGLQVRVRTCDNPPPTNSGQFCAGSDQEKKPCKLRECPVDGMWSNWGHWTPCTRSCDGGTRTRQKLCNNPAPMFGGLLCVGTDTQVDYCNNEPCPVHGGWSNWGAFGECSVSCNGGVKRRYRTCSLPAPSNNGRPCPGASEDSDTCNQVPCPVDGRWSEWSRWSECSRTCDSGTQRRTRRCREPRYGGQPCVGDMEQVSNCELQPCYTIPIVAEGNLKGFINNIDIADGTFTADMIPLPDQTATHINAAIRGVPKSLVPHFRHLISILSPLYWMTAMEINGAYNGYTLTDGEFSREVQVQYTTGEVLKMWQFAKGVENGKLLLDVVVQGKVPDIAESEVVKVTPYWEQYLQTGPGSVHAYSSRMFRVGGYMLPYAWNHSIVYEQENNKNMPYLVQRLYARNMDVKINPEKELVLFKLDTSIAPGSPSNQCPTGFSLNQAGPYCEDDDECARLSPCSDHCHNTPGSFACSCPTGFTLDIDGRSCIDINECLAASAGCQGDEKCVNTIGSYRCELRCRTGYRKSVNGNICVDIDECVETPSVCSQICVNTKGGYRCRCWPGYTRSRLSGSRCIDINECSLQSSPCEQICANAPGSYLCSCKRGFELVSGGRCRDINECEENRSNCGPDQNCVNALGSYRCITVCPKGSKLVLEKCVDIDECKSGKHRCYFNQRCVNTDPGYRCVCPRGYRSAGPGTPCLDIDECKDDPGICQHNCTNTVGSFECLCPPGYRLSRDGKLCEDINECIEMNINCGDEKMCFNTLGEFTCIDIPCPTKYQRDPITNYCVLECIDAEIACPPNAKHADVIQFRTLALPSGIHQLQDLIQLIAYNQNNETLRNTVFTILENDKKVPFQIRLDDGIGYVFTPKPLEQLNIYKIKVKARSYDNEARNIQYQVTFMIHISVSAYPY